MCDFGYLTIAIYGCACVYAYSSGHAYALFTIERLVYRAARDKLKT